MEPEPTCGECSHHYAYKDACLASGEEGGYYKDTEACELFIPKGKLCKLDEEKRIDTDKLTCSMCIYYYLYRDTCPNQHEFEKGARDGRSHVCTISFKWLDRKFICGNCIEFRKDDSDDSSYGDCKRLGCAVYCEDHGCIYWDNPDMDNDIREIIKEDVRQNLKVPYISRSDIDNTRGFIPKTISASDLVYGNADHDRSTPETDDPVHHPSHYTQGEVECIDAIRSSMSPTEFRGYLKGQVLKYIWRYDKKNNPIEDLRKAIQYLNWLIDEITKI